MGNGGGLVLRHSCLRWGLTFHEKRVGFTFLADGGERAVAGDHYGFVGEGQDRVVQRVQYFLHRAAGQIGATNGTREECVAGDQLIFRGEIEADAAFGVSGSVQDTGGEGAGGDGFSGGNAAVDLNFSRRAHADPGGLGVEHFQQGIVVLVEQDGGAGGGAKLHGSANMVDVSVGDDDLVDLQVALADECKNILNIVAEIDDHGPGGGLVADDRAVALQRADGEDFVDHGDIVASRAPCET